MVKKYRDWLSEYFSNEFNYESTLFMNLNKVREFIVTEQAEKKQPYPTPREYDLVVRVDNITEAPQEGVKELFGSANADYSPGFIRSGAETSPKKVGYKLLQISDCTSLVFELWVPGHLMPPGLKCGDVIRVKSCIASIR
jgi:hypothetical protein